jgi:hypothetical protein
MSIAAKIRKILLIFMFSSALPAFSDSVENETERIFSVNAGVLASYLADTTHLELELNLKQLGRNLGLDISIIYTTSFFDFYGYLYKMPAENLHSLAVSAGPLFVLSERGRDGGFRLSPKIYAAAAGAFLPEGFEHDFFTGLELNAGYIFRNKAIYIDPSAALRVFYTAKEKVVLPVLIWGCYIGTSF